MSRVGLHPVSQRDRARDAFTATQGIREAWVRHTEIELLPMVEWKGKTLRTIRCNGITGKGPHTVNVPDALLWALIDLRDWCCPYHPR